MPDWIIVVLLTGLFVAIVAESQQGFSVNASTAAGETIKLCVILGAILLIVVPQAHHHAGPTHKAATILASCDIPHICQGAKTTHTATP